MLKDVLPVDKRTLKSYFTRADDRRYILRLAAALLAITAVSALLLGLVHYGTEPIIRARTEEKTGAAMQAVLEADYYRDPLSYETENGVTAISEAVSDGQVTGYVCRVEGRGFGGPMDLVVGVDLEDCVTGVVVIRHSETNHVGTRAVESEEVLAGFAGLSAPVVSGSREGEVDLVSGATHSTDGVVAAVNAALDAVAKYKSEGGV